MQPPPQDRPRPVRAPSFALIGPQPIRPATLVLAVCLAASALYGLRYALEQARHRHAANQSDARSQSAADAAKDANDDKDDPSQIDTIVLGDPADAPRPGRHGDHVSPVHPTIVVRLPRYGDDTGMIPATPAGHLLYRWLAAFNQASPSALAAVLPSRAPASTLQALQALRTHTGGFALVSAREVQPGVLVFRLRDQTLSATEVLGSLQVDPGTEPTAIATFSLRAVPPPARPQPGSHP